MSMDGRMMEDRANAALEQVYAARSPEEIAAAYAEWAAAYDRETAALGYLLPFVITAWVARYVPDMHAPILDAGCGTGLSGPSLQALGFSNVAGIDISDKMLEIAATRDAYVELKRGALGGPLPWPENRFRAFFSTGVFTMGHAPASSFHELIRITARGGHAIFTVRDQALNSGGFPAMFRQLEEQKKWRFEEESPWFRCYAVAEPDAKVKTFVYEIL